MRSRRLRGRTQRRRSHWLGADIYSSTGGSYTNQDAITFWAKWPSGTVQPAGNNPLGIETVEPKDETVVKSFVQVDFSAGPPGILGDDYQVQVGFGLIAWETMNPENFDIGVFSGSPIDFTIEQPPRPILEPNLQWLYHQTYSGSGTGTLFPFVQGVGTDIQNASKAQRKLPQNTGLLMVINFQLFPEATELQNVRYQFHWRGLIKDV